ncbi:MAG TPA: CheR family methyltransferase, partial [Abditibacterium sp.]
MQNPETNPEFEALLTYLKQVRGFDFTAYKRASLVRRVQKRMEDVGITSFLAYIGFLEAHPNEFTALFNTILINVTSFFRDPPAWDFLREQVLPVLVAAGEEKGAIRIWSAGCASGEEAYSLAMALAELMGLSAVRDRVKIYATDADEEALAEARQAVYSARRLESLAPELRDKYFEPLGDRFAFHRELRRSVIFGRHDLVQDAPISRIDLLLCRNALMYFGSAAQKRILARFHFALREGGFLFLGKSETLLTHTALFEAVDLRRRIFAKVSSNEARDVYFAKNRASGEPMIQHLIHNGRLREAAADAVTTAQVLIDYQGMVTQANLAARALFGLGAKDLGRPLQDLEISYRPLEVRSLVEKATLERRPQTVSSISWPTPTGEARYLDVEITPLLENSGNLLGTSITFTDVTLFRRLQDELLHTNQELETTLEELQSTNEELETTNEELQSTNEELETMNEELQATNEELQAINDEFRVGSTRSNEANGFLESILASLRDGIIVLDSEMQV